MGGKKVLSILILFGFLVQFFVPFAPAQAVPSLSVPHVSIATPRVALELDGVGDYMQVPHNPALNPSSGITIEAWVYRFNATRCETVVGKNYNTGYWLGFCSNTIRFYPHGSGSFVDGVTPIPARVWTHIAVTYDGTTRRYYVNGNLDIETTSLNGPLTFTDSPLGIGSDPLNGYDFQGYIDQVWISAYARQQYSIRSSMYGPSGGYGSLAVYPLDNNTEDTEIPYNHGTLQGNAKFTSLGARSQRLSIGRAGLTPTIDGLCQLAEYSGATQVDIGSGTAYLYNTTTDLFACINGMTNGIKATAKISIDPRRGRYANGLHDDTPPQTDNFRFSIEKNGVTTAEQGTGFAFQPATPAVDSWQAAATEQSPALWSAEFRISRSLINIGDDIFGLLLTESVSGQPDQHAPGSGLADRPLRWNPASASIEMSTAGFTISGNVIDEDTGAGIPDAYVETLYNINGAVFPVGSTRTNASGEFIQNFTAYPGGTFIIQTVDQPGYTSRSANPGAGGTILTSNIVTYPAPAAGSLPPVTFLDSRRPVSRSFDRHYLIVYSEPATFSDIYPLIEMKRNQGFNVQAITTQSIAVSVTGRDLAEKVRNWLKARWTGVDPDAVYVLLIGRHDKIPFREVGWLGDQDHRLPSPAYFPAIAIDWYYADLDSNWDSDNDGWYGEFLFCPPGVNAVPLAGADLPGLCPVAGSPLREGPYGVSSTTSDDWKAEVSLGRLPLNTREEVRQGINTILSGESSASLVKRKALMGGAFWWFNGQTWDTATSSYLPGLGPFIQGAWPGDGNQPFGFDNAEYMERLLRPAIAPYTTTLTALYETTSPNGDPTLSPSARSGFSIAAINRTNFLNAWNNDYGLVSVAGHGNHLGVYQESWVNDYNNDRIIENPANPAESTGCTTNCNETAGAPFIDFDFPVAGEVPSVVFANACLTGDVWQNIPGAVTPWVARDVTLPSKLITSGAVAAWSGALNLGATGTLERFNAQYAGDILGKPLLLGDAHWKGAESTIQINLYDWRLAIMELFGDPAYSYWGNPLDRRSSWPQSGGDWFASGASNLPGPLNARIQWSNSENAPRTSPVISANGSIVVGTTAGPAFYRPDGTRQTAPALSGITVNYPAAVTRDGYYVAAGNFLYALTPNRDVRWIVNLGSAVTGEPHVGPDGIIWVSTASGMARLTGAGVVEILNGGLASAPATSPAVLGLNGSAVWIANGTHLRGHWMNRDGQVTILQLGLGSGVTAASMPSVAPNGSIYVGTNTGRLVQFPGFPTFASGWSFTADGSILNRPANRLDSSVYFVTSAGSVYAVAADGSLLWRNPLGVAPAGDPIIDENYLYLTAGDSLSVLNLASGEVAGMINLGGALDARSTPAISAGQTVYITRADNTLVKLLPWNYLPAPTGLLATSGPGGISLSWLDNSSDEKGFRLEFCAISGGCNLWKTLPPNTTQELVTQLDPTQSFFFRVSAVGGVGPGGMGLTLDSLYAQSEPANPPPPAPAVPVLTLAQARSAAAIQLTWTYAGSTDLLTGFTLQRADAPGGPWSNITSLGATQRSVQDLGLDANKTYHYRIIANNRSGSSSPSNVLNATTRGLSLPAPAMLAFLQVKNHIQLSWPDSGTTESGYRILRRLPGVGEFEPIAEVSANTTSYEDPFYELVEEKVEYQVVAFNATQESHPTWGAWTFAMTMTYNTYLPQLNR